jgi:hypothetical protein
VNLIADDHAEPVIPKAAKLHMQISIVGVHPAGTCSVLANLDRCGGAPASPTKRRWASSPGRPADSHNPKSTGG